MSDEPRRSVRATKGQHKTLDLLDLPAEAAPKKGRGKKGGNKKAESQEPAEDAEIIRCICGAIEQDDNSDEKWISCETCNVWQHNICMGVTIDEKELETLDYFCEECRPEDHKETLAAIARDEKPWKDRQRAFEESQAESKGKKKKGGKGKRASDQKPAEKNSKASTPSTPAPELKKEIRKETVQRAGSVKRKAEETQDEPAKTKVRKVSASQDTPTKSSTPTDIPSTLSQLAPKRQAVAKFILKNLTAAMKIAKKNGIYKSSEPELDAKAMRLTLEIERATHDTCPEGAPYTDQGRRLAANLKTNQELCDKLLLKKLTPSTFATMSGDEMASKELQKQTAEMKARADKQSIMISDDGPRVRRTHKGDEVIEDESVAPGEDISAFRRRSMLDPNGDMATRSRENSPGEGNELPQDLDDYQSRDNIRAQVAPSGPLSLNTSGSPPPQRKQSTQANDFDINKVFSSVQSPTVPHHARKPSIQIPPKDGPGEDADIDRMLDDGTDSPPYSPAEFDPDPSIIWRGQMLMNSIASFPAVGRHIGGADLTLCNDPVSFAELIPSKLSVAGRIEQDKANEYLCSLRYSPNTDVVIIALSPSGDASKDDFIKLHEYFSSKGKYGVVGSKSYANTRDTYLVPVSSGTGDIPEFMLNLENNKLPGDRPEPMILIVLVVRTGSAQNTPRQERPTGISQRQMSMTGPQGPAMSPINQQGAFPSPSPGPQQPQQKGYPPQQYPPPQHYQGHPPPAPYSTTPDQRAREQAIIQQKGEAVAHEILGEHLYGCPTVKFLLPQAYTMQSSEWNVIKEILLKHEEARTDLPYLSKLLEQHSGPEKGQ